MGLRMTNLDGQWKSFVDTYDRINQTCGKLYRVELLAEEREANLGLFARVRDILKSNQMIQDTSMLLTQEIHADKRDLAAGCSSSLMDEYHGIYPFTDSFLTITGYVCTGLGVPDEAIETEIGVLSAMTILRTNFLKHMNRFPTQVS